MSNLGPITLGDLGDLGDRPAAAVSRPSVPPRPTRGRGRALAALIDEVSALHRRLGGIVGRGNGRAPVSVGQRDILKELGRQGPRTVPQMARTRSLSRQHVQSQVNGLAGDGYVELIDNPAHKRSRRVRLTPRGRELLEEMDRGRAYVFSRLDVAASVEELRRATAVLGRLREVLEEE